VIQLKYDPGDGTQPLHGGTDPGRTNIGEAVLNDKGEVVFKAHVTTRNKDIPKLISDRRQHRQASRKGERLARKRLAKQLGTTFKGLMERILPGCDKPVKLTDGLTAHEVQQFRRHDRQIVEAQRERTYKLDGVTVAKNRRPRSEQPKDCPALSVWYEQRIKAVCRRQADLELSRLTVKKSVRYYNNIRRMLPGAVFIYGGMRCVMNSQYSKGAYYRAYGEGSTNYPTRDVTVVRKNAELVFVG